MYNTYQYSLYAGYAGNYSVYGYYYPTYNQPIYSPYLYNYNDYYYYQPVTPQQTTSSSKQTKTKELKRSKRNYNNQTNVKEPIKHISSTNQQQNSEIITRFQKDSTFLSLKNELKKINKNSTFQKDFSSIPPVKLTNNLQKIDKFQATQTSTNNCSQPIPEPIQTRCTQFIEPKNNCSSECTESNKILPSYVSKIEQAILNSTEPITTESSEVIEVNGVRGIWLNKSEVESWQGEIPLTDYEINNDSDPEIVKLKHASKYKTLFLN